MRVNLFDIVSDLQMCMDTIEQSIDSLERDGDEFEIGREMKDVLEEHGIGDIHELNNFLENVRRILSVLFPDVNWEDDFDYISDAWINMRDLEKNGFAGFDLEI